MELLRGRLITHDLALQWPCELREYWSQLLPLTAVIENLLHYGTIVIIVFGLVFNLMSMIVFTTKGMRKHSQNSYLLALAIYESNVLVFNFMVGVLRAQHSDIINRVFEDNEWLCITHSVVVELFNLLSIWMLVCMTVERCVVVIFPLKASKLCSLRNSRITVIVATLILSLISCHKILVSGFEGDSVYGYKACITNRIKLSSAIYVYVALNTWLPMVIIITANIVILVCIYRTRNKLTAFGSRNTKAPGRGRSRQDRLTRTMIMISLAYIVLLLPLGITQMVELFWNSTRKCIPSAILQQQLKYIEYRRRQLLLKCIRSLCFFVYQVNYSVNFFIYCLSNPKFRLALRSFLPCLRKGEQRSQLGASSGTQMSRLTAPNSVHSNHSTSIPTSMDSHTG